MEGICTAPLSTNATTAVFTASMMLSTTSWSIASPSVAEMIAVTNVSTTTVVCGDMSSAGADAAPSGTSTSTFNSIARLSARILTYLTT